ncbi:MAG: ATP-binding protein [Bacteroidales bacterium]|nr:ATP-binding protein [Bacteroidales bacterium]
MDNPFKFGTVVEGAYFTDRVDERAFLTQILHSPNHAILISPRRYGKSSLVAETLRSEKRESISLNMQAVTSSVKLAEALYRRFFSRRPIEKARHYLSHLRIIPTLSINPVSGSPEVSFLPNVNAQVVLEDVFAMLEKAGQKKKLIVVLDEFQEILQIEKGLDKLLRSIMQEQQNINYILMGSQEDMMKKIFLRKKSAFYHFGNVIHLDRIPEADFKQYIEDRLPTKNRGKGISDDILSFTACHPYYTQQLAFQVWFELQQGAEIPLSVPTAIEHIIQAHDFDYSRLWESMNRTNRLVLLKLADNDKAPMENPELPPSTIFSALKRLVSAGILIKNGKYVYDDPFFKRWVKRIM